MPTEAERHAIEMHALTTALLEDKAGPVAAITAGVQVTGMVGYQLALLNDNMERLIVEVRTIGWRT